jgi:hypothetical protein
VRGVLGRAPQIAVDSVSTGNSSFRHAIRTIRNCLRAEVRVRRPRRGSRRHAGRGPATRPYRSLRVECGQDVGGGHTDSPVKLPFDLVVSTVRDQPCSVAWAAYQRRSRGSVSLSSRTGTWRQGSCATSCCTISVAGLRRRTACRTGRDARPRVCGNSARRFRASWSMTSAPNRGLPGVRGWLARGANTRSTIQCSQCIPAAEPVRPARQQQHCGMPQGTSATRGACLRIRLVFR